MSELRFKEDALEQGTSDFWYDLTIGGYIKPEDFLTPADAKRVNEAIELVCEFERIAKQKELIYSL